MRKLRKKWKRPRVSWNTALIKEEKELLKEYGLKRKKELYRAREILRQYRRRARNLIAVHNPEKEKTLIDKLVKLAILKKSSELDDILALTVNDILNRRLQTIVLKRGMATSINHARQMIVHGKIAIEKRKAHYPSYLVTLELENKIGLYKGGK